MNTAINKKSLSQGEMLFCEISEDERRRIKKFFPFRDLRDRTILELRERGATIKSIHELSGLDMHSVIDAIRRARLKRKAEKMLMGKRKRR